MTHFSSNFLAAVVAIVLTAVTFQQTVAIPAASVALPQAGLMLA